MLNCQGPIQLGEGKEGGGREGREGGRGEDADLECCGCGDVFVIVYMHCISPVVSNELNYELWSETGQPLLNDMRTQTHALNTQVHMLYMRSLFKEHSLMECKGTSLTKTWNMAAKSNKKHQIRNRCFRKRQGRNQLELWTSGDNSVPENSLVQESGEPTGTVN